jgi:hypothetical protein
VGAAPASNHAFLLPIPEWAVKKAATIHTTSDTVLPSTLSQLTTRYTPRSGFLGVGQIRSSITPAAMTRPTSTTASQQKNDACTSTTGIARPLQRQDVLPSHHPHRHDAPGWLARTRARRHSSAHSARPAFFFKTPLGFSL